MHQNIWKHLTSTQIFHQMQAMGKMWACRDVGLQGCGLLWAASVTKSKLC